MNNNIYLNKLIEQFKMARGITTDIYSIELIKEFKEWLLHTQIQGEEYGRILGKNCIYFGSDKYAEVGKGPKDSIALMYEEMDTTIVSPYFEGYKDDNSYRNFINGELSVIGSKPALIKKTDDIIPYFDVIKPQDIKVFMTHNPYNLYDIINWRDLHNNQDNGIIVGIYGNTYDKDYNDKVRFIESFRTYTNVPYNFDSFTINDKYFCVFNTDMYEKTKPYIKTKNKYSK